MPTPQTAEIDYGFGLDDERVREDGDTLTISGLASNFDLDRENDQMARGAFDKALGRYLRENPILLYSHRPSMPMGVVTKAYVDPAGLHVEAKLPKPEPGTEAANVWRLVKAGVVRAFSVGGLFKRSVVAGVKTVTEVDLREVSIAPLGVVSGALFSVQAGKAFADAPTDRLSALRADLAAIEAASAKADVLGLKWAGFEARSIARRTH